MLYPNGSPQWPAVICLWQNICVTKRASSGIEIWSAQLHTIAYFNHWKRAEASTVYSTSLFGKVILLWRLMVLVSEELPLWHSSLSFCLQSIPVSMSSSPSSSTSDIAPGYAPEKPEDGPNIPATHVKTWVELLASTWPSLALVVIGRTNQWMEDLYHCLSLCQIIF